MGNLQQVKIGDICHVVKGNIGISKAIPGVFPLVTTGPNRLSHNEFQFDCKAVCIPLVSSAGHGKASLNYVHYQEEKFALGNILCACIPFDENSIDVRYLHLYLQTFKNDLLVPLMRGMANVSLTTDKIKNVEVILPDLQTQQNIVSRLQSLQALHREADATLARLHGNVKRLRQSILQEAIQGKLVDYKPAPDEKTGAELLADIRAEKERRAREAGKKPEAPLPPVTPEEMPFEVPEGWVWCRLGEVIFSAKDGPHFSPDYSTSGTPFISTRNISPDGIDFSSSKYITTQYHQEISKRCKPEKGDILYTKGGTTGIACVNEHEIDFNVWVHVAVLKIPSLVNPYYLKNALNSPHCYTQSQQLTKGIGNQDLGLKRMVTITLPLPPYSQQSQIVKEINARLAQCDKLDQILTALQTKTERLWKSELQQAFKFDR